MYEERAVDVVIDNRPQDFLKKFPQSAPPSKIVNDDINRNNNDDKLIKIKRPQGGGTVRSIPIKDYQASIAHNIGTLRRSVAPQSQFETLVSEPERCVYMPSRKRASLINGHLHHRNTCIAAQMQAGNAHEKSSCHFCDQRDSRDFYRADVNLNVESNQCFNNTDDRKSQDGSDIDEYFRRTSRGKSGSCDHRVSRRAREFSENTGTAAGTKNEGTRRTAEEADASKLTEGHVGQKVTAYEQNARRSPRNPDTRYRSLFEVKGHRTIGVPLVGMHNACGLPVVASWHDRELLDTLRIGRRIAGTVGSIYKCPRTVPNVRRRNQPKRRAPQPDGATIHSRDVDRSLKGSTIKSIGYVDNINNSERAKRRHRRSSFTTTRVGSLSSKNSFKRTARFRRHGINASSLVDTFGRRSIKGGSAKRTTLYAKDDGEEAVKVLKSLCLNPLARVETDMMW